MTKKLLTILGALVFVLVVWIVALGLTKNEDRPTWDNNQIVDSNVENNNQVADSNAGEDNEVVDSGVMDSIFENDSISGTDKEESSEPATTPKPTATPKPEETKKPEETRKPEETVEPSEPGTLDYLTFQNMNPEDQQIHMESFESIDAFFEWYNAAKEKYEKENPPIEVDGGVIDIGSIIEGKE